MSKLQRAGFEALITVCVTLAVSIGAFAPIFGYQDLLDLSSVYYGVWSVAIILIHILLAGRQRHIRLSFGVATGVVVMGAHLAMYLLGNIDTDIDLIPVVMHDFGFALVALITLNIVHLVIFRRKKIRLAPPAEDLARIADGEDAAFGKSAVETKPSVASPAPAPADVDAPKARQDA